MYARNVHQTLRFLSSDDELEKTAVVSVFACRYYLISDNKIFIE